MFPGVQPAPHWDAVKEFPSLFDRWHHHHIPLAEMCDLSTKVYGCGRRDGRTPSAGSTCHSLRPRLLFLCMSDVRPFAPRTYRVENECSALNRADMASPPCYQYASKEEIALGIGAISKYVSMCIHEPLSRPVLWGRFFVLK